MGGRGAEWNDDPLTNIGKGWEVWREGKPFFYQSSRYSQRICKNMFNYYIVLYVNFRLFNIVLII